MKPFRERNQAVIGVAGILVLGVAFLGAFFSDDLPLIGAGQSYTAEFREAAGLKPENKVEVAGIKVGKVTEVKLNRDKVIVKFRVKDAWVGDQTLAAIKIGTLLGAKFLELDPKGNGPLSPSKPIPLDRTTSPYDVTDAFSGLSDAIGKVDTAQMAKSFQVLSETFQNTPKNVKGALDGLSALSKTISSRDAELGQLLGNTSDISKTLADRDAEFQKLVADGSLLLTEIQQRKEAISALLTGTQKLSKELQGLVSDNNQQLRPALEQLDKLTTMLRANQDALGKGLQQLGPFARLLANSASDGRWLNGFLCNYTQPMTEKIC